MADKTDIKRLNYFTGQFLEALDFQEEQNYHIGMRRRLNRLLYSPGVVDIGFDVTKVGEKRIKVSAGLAIDKEGRELVIIGVPPEKDVSGFAANAPVYVALRYAEPILEEDKRAKADISGYIRSTERPEIRLLSALPSGNDVGIDIPVAKLQLDAGGNIQPTIDTSVVRQLANLIMRGGKVGIGTTEPKSSLSVTGGLAVGAGYAGTNAAPANGLLVEGNVGIGTTGPGAKLEVANQTLDDTAFQPLIRLMANQKDESPSNVFSESKPSYGIEFLRQWNNNGTKVQAGIYAWGTGNFGSGLAFRTRLPGSGLSTRMVITDLGNVGIGATGPGAKLEVAVVADDANTKSLVVGKGTTNYLTMLNNGNVGIGTTAPGAKLEVSVTNQAGTGTITSSGTTVTGSGTAFQTQLQVGDSITASGQPRTITAISSGTALIVDSAFSPNIPAATAFTFSRPALLVEGNVGIGTTAPGANLDVGGKHDTPGQVSLQLRSGNNAANYDSNQITLGHANRAEYRHAIKTRHNATVRSGNAIDFYVWKYLSANEKDAKETIGTLHTMTLDGGNVGIGATAPGAKLEVAVAATDADTKPLVVGKGATNYLTMLNNGNVGIGTTGPGAKLEVGVAADDANTKPLVVGKGATNYLTILNDGKVGIGATDPTTDLQFRNVVKDSKVEISRKAVKEHDAGNVPSELSLGIHDGGFGGVRIINERKMPSNNGNNQYICFHTHSAWESQGERMRIAPSGFVGIGTTSPAAKLHINGYILQNLDVIETKNNGDWANKDHPIVQYFKKQLRGQPKGTFMKAYQDHKDWKNRYYEAWVSSSNPFEIQITHTQGRVETIKD